MHSDFFLFFNLCEVIIEMLSSSNDYEMDRFIKLVKFHSWQVKEAKGISNTETRYIMDLNCKCSFYILVSMRIDYIFLPCHYSDNSTVWVLDWLEMEVGFHANRSGMIMCAEILVIFTVVSALLIYVVTTTECLDQ